MRLFFGRIVFFLKRRLIPAFTPGFRPFALAFLLVALGNQGLAQGPSLSPVSVSFGNVVMSTTSAAKAVTLKNSQTGTLNISGISAGGDYAETNTCGSSLLAGASCTIRVTFTPSTTGSRTGTLTVSDNASASPQTATLSGTGVLAATVSPGALAFGDQVINTASTAKTVTLKNNQTISLNIASITAAGDFGQSNNCGSSVVAGGSCTISVTFTPSATGSRPGTLTITDDAADNPQAVSLAGTGVLAATVSPGALGFGDQVINTASAAKTVTLKNNQTISLNIASIAAVGDFGQSNNCGSSVMAGGSCTIQVTFTPSAGGPTASTGQPHGHAGDNG